MKLYFTCPAHEKIFSTEAYCLQQNYCVITSKNGAKELQGKVDLTSPCPCCGEKHRFDVSEIVCPMSRSEENI